MPYRLTSYHMLRGLLWLAQIVLAALIVYNLAVALAGWRDPAKAAPGPRQRRFRIAIPAHNEEAVIAGVVGDLKNLSYRPDLFTIAVIADRCTDQTADKARAAGAEVVERVEGPDGKGAVLRWFTDTRPMATDEALVVVDADNRVPVDFLSGFSDEIDVGGQVLQAYLDVQIRMVRNRHSLGPLLLGVQPDGATGPSQPGMDGGSGWDRHVHHCRSLAAAGGLGDSLVKDQELGVRLFLSGHPVQWLHDVRIGDEKPAAVGVAIRQRSRWVTGRRQVARAFFGQLLRRRSPASWDLALRLVQPSRMGVAALSAALAVASALGLALWAWWVWAAVAAVQFLAPLPFLATDPVPGRYIVRYPLLILLPLLKVPARLFRNQGWYHTPHEGSGPGN